MNARRTVQVQDLERNLAEEREKNEALKQKISELQCASEVCLFLLLFACIPTPSISRCGHFTFLCGCHFLMAAAFDKGYTIHPCARALSSAASQSDYRLQHICQGGTGIAGQRRLVMHV